MRNSILLWHLAFCGDLCTFDKFKNQWGWAGFATQKLKPCKVMARLIAAGANGPSTSHRPMPNPG